MDWFRRFIASRISDALEMKSDMNDVLLKFDGIGKSFPGVKALDDIHMEFRAGEIHALVGENGAGKSTLMKILSGVYQPDTGKIIYRGQPVVLRDPHHAQNEGISIIFQEFSLIGNMTVTENVFLNREPRNALGFLDREAARAGARELMARLDVEMDPDARVEDLSVVNQQLVEIMKALSVDARILIMDEPSAALTDKELEKLFVIIRALKKRGVTIIYISHMLEEVFALADRVTVIKDGRCMGTFDVGELNKDSLVRHMVGRDIGDIYPPLGSPSDDVALEVRGLSDGSLLDDVSFTLRKGEILGLAGMAGSGRTQLMRTILGERPMLRGELFVGGRAVTIHDIGAAIGMGFCYIPADRKKEGIVASMNIMENTTITALRKFLSAGIVNRKSERVATRRQVDSLRIKTPSPYAKIENLSGGNQQKVLLSRALLSEPTLFFIAEPTRGIDVGAKHEIYKILRQLADQGNSVLMMSSELPEVLGMSDRILVLHRGTVAGVVDQHTRRATEELILSLAVGHEYTLSAEASI